MASPNSHDSPVVFPPNGFRWPATVAFLLGAIVVFFAVMIAGGIYYGVTHRFDIGATQRALTGMAGVTIQGVAELVVIAFIALLLPGLARTSLGGIGFRRISGSQAAAIVIAAIAMFAIVTPLASVLQSVLHFKTPEEAIAVFSRTSGWHRIAFAFFGVVLAPAFEEAVFRIVIFNAMRTWWGLWPGAIVSSILFGLAHSQPPFTPAMFVSITFPLAVGGVVLCMVYAKTNNAWSSFFTHAAFNGFSLILLALFPQLAK